MLLCPFDPQFFNNDGTVASGAKLYTYATGTTSLLTSYQTQAGTAHTNPITLDSAGRVQPALWLTAGLEYRLRLETASGALIDEWDDIYGVGDGSASLLADTSSLSNGDAMIGVKRSETGAVATTQHEVNARYVSAFDFMTVAQIADVKARGFTEDVTAAIQAAINAAVTLRATLLIPAGTYKIVPATSVTSEAGTETIAFTMASHMHIDAEPGAIFKLADSQSTDGTPKALEMFFTNSTLTNVSIRGLTMDMNGANNKISPSRPGTYDTSKNMGMVCVSGTPSGVAARIDDCVIEDCTFQNTSGVCCIVVAQSNSTGVTLGKRWTIRNNLFLNNGTDTNDHTSIFAWADDVLCEGNTFWQDSQYATTGKTGGVTAYEVHGSNHRFIGNRVRNYLRGMWVGPNLTSTVEGSIIKGNNFETMFYGVDFFRATSSQTASRDTLIEGNTFLFDSDIYTGGPTQKAAVNIACDYAVSDIVIRGNILRSSDTATDAGTSLAIITPGSVAANTYKNIYIEDNAQYGGTDGVYVVTNATNGLGHLSVVNNRFVDLSNAAVSTAPIGVFVNGVTAVSSLVIDGNQFIETRGSSQFDYGIFVQGTVTNHMLGNNYAVGMVSSNYTESSFTATNRAGPTNSTVLTGSATYDPPNLADGAGATTTVTVTGAALGDYAQAAFNGDTGGITITAWVSASNTVSVRFQNESGGALDIGSSTLRARVIKAS